jgi:hypothetical protein
MNIMGNVSVRRGGEALIVWSRNAIRLRMGTNEDCERRESRVIVRMGGRGLTVMVSNVVYWEDLWDVHVCGVRHRMCKVNDLHFIGCND